MRRRSGAARGRPGFFTFLSSAWRFVAFILHLSWGFETTAMTVSCMYRASTEADDHFRWLYFTFHIYTITMIPFPCSNLDGFSACVHAPSQNPRFTKPHGAPIGGYLTPPFSTCGVHVQRSASGTASMTLATCSPQPNQVVFSAHSSVAALRAG